MWFARPGLQHVEATQVRCSYKHLVRMLQLTKIQYTALLSCQHAFYLEPVETHAKIYIR